MSISTPVALVTGANKGIGFTIVQALCKHFTEDVYLTAWDPERGQAAVAKLQEEGLSPLFHQLDITDLQSIRTLRDFLKEKYGGLNVLVKVNNTGLWFKGRAPADWQRLALARARFHRGSMDRLRLCLHCVVTRLADTALVLEQTGLQCT